MESIEQILGAAAGRTQAMQAPYAGAVLPEEAQALLKGLEGAVLVDVRTQAEIDWVGFVPGALHIEWQRYPGGVANPDFLARLASEVSPERPVLFLCRSGGRSHAAAVVAAQAGYTRSYNVLQGFEGDRDAEGHRNTLAGWRAAGLPWKQS
jgi:rhodanese-related sulfurtransferase